VLETDLKRLDTFFDMLTYGKQ